MKLLIIAAMLLGVTLGCSGQMDGVIRRDAKRIEITYTDSRVSVAELIAVLPDGEHFRGRSERLDRTKEMMETDSTDTDDLSGHFEALQTFPGNTKATLSGNRGNVIKCRFKLTDVIIGFASGGTGLCQISDERVIDVFF
ncbi:hypothetical protein D1BOALGB6SA_2313 [Olavius sp. associated proteobacterium Delta 1]|nr:hypothetical protein D1BOALGB6SA_2313 [Olavius sp. associated proteobacterium Delta 1]